MKAATPCRLRAVRMCGISIHAAREGGDLYRIYKSTIKVISIHAAREGGDVCNAKTDINADIFQSTPPVKAATSRPAERCQRGFISIHAAREGGDVYKSFNLLFDS